jgi:23S rRNA (cytidine1920-2'-O)/16S rRNA (cytidine1409-2'-O)-methyltransferase
VTPSFSHAAGKVLVDGKPVTKTGTQVKPDADVVITAEQPKYVCR